MLRIRKAWGVFRPQGDGLVLLQVEPGGESAGNDGRGGEIGIGKFAPAAASAFEAGGNHVDAVQRCGTGAFHHHRLLNGGCKTGVQRQTRERAQVLFVHAAVGGDFEIDLPDEGGQ